MREIIRKFVFRDLLYFKEYENYFYHMSKKGLHLKKIGKIFAYFEEGDNKEINYRIDLVNKDDKENIIEKRKKEGWDFIGGKDSALIFSSKGDSELRELYGTPALHKIALGNYREKRYKGNVFSIISVTIFLIIYIVILSDKGFYISLTKESSFGLSMIIALISLFHENSKRRYLKRMENFLGEGKFLDHEADEFVYIKRTLRKTIINFTLALTIISILFCKLFYGRKISLGEVHRLGDLPIVTIADIEKVETYTNFSNNNDTKNHVYTNWNIFVPKEYDLIESVELYDENNIDTGLKPLLVFRYYDARFEFIAKGLEKDMLAGRGLMIYSGLREIKTTDNTSVYGLEDKHRIVLLFRKENQIIYIIYHDGRVSLKELIEVISEKFKTF